MQLDFRMPRSSARDIGMQSPFLTSVTKMLDRHNFQGALQVGNIPLGKTPWAFASFIPETGRRCPNSHPPDCAQGHGALSETAAFARTHFIREKMFLIK